MTDKLYCPCGQDLDSPKARPVYWVKAAKVTVCGACWDSLTRDGPPDAIRFFRERHQMPFLPSYYEAPRRG